MDYKDVELTDGRVVRVYSPPTVRIAGIIEKRHPRPQAPMVKETTRANKEIVMTIDDDPEYLAKLNEWNRVRNEEADEMGSLFMFKDVVPPDDWDIEAEVGDEVRYFDPDWKPREGKVGRKLDYIQWTIMDDVVNSKNVTQALRELAGIDMEEVKGNLDSFPSPLEGETA